MNVPIELIENLQREDLNPMDVAEALYTFFKDRQGEVSPEEILKLFRPMNGTKTGFPATLQSL